MTEKYQSDSALSQFLEFLENKIGDVLNDAPSELASVACMAYIAYRIRNDFGDPATAFDVFDKLAMDCRGHLGDLYPPNESDELPVKGMH